MVTKVVAFGPAGNREGIDSILGNPDAAAVDGTLGNTVSKVIEGVVKPPS